MRFDILILEGGILALALKPVIELNKLLKSKRMEEDSAALLWSAPGEEIEFFSRSSLAVVSLAFSRELSCGSKPTIWFPSLICVDAVTAVKKAGFCVDYYNGSSPKVSLDAVCSGVDIVIFVHYFGDDKGDFLPDYAHYCRMNKIWLVEDAAHINYKRGKVGCFGDYTYYSLYKHFPIPDGAILVRRITNNQSILKSDQLRAHLVAQGHKVQSKPSKLRQVVWFGREILRRFIGSVNYSVNVDENEVTQPGVCPKSFLAPEISDISTRLLIPHARSKSNVLRRIRSASEAWRFVVGEIVFAHDLNIILGPVSCQYLIPINVKGPLVNKSLKKLASFGIPILSWPDLPLKVGNKQESKRAFFIPVNQSMKPSKIFSLLGINKLNEANRPIGHVAFQEDEELSNSPFKSHTPLVQTLTYGKARAQVGSQLFKKIIYSQELSSKAKITLNIRMIKRGPFCLNLASFGPNFEGPTQVNEAISYMSKVGRDLGSWYRLNVFVTSPYVLNNAASNYALWASGYRWIDLVDNWKSSKLNLADNNMHMLRSRLNQKWRNQLKKAEKSDMNIICSDAFDDIRHIHHMSEQYLQSIGIPSIHHGIINFTLKSMGNDSSDVVLRAYNAVEDESVVSGIVVATTNNEATYLIGWNSPRGRSLYANQLLLWTAMADSQKNGILSFDLGGIDEEKSSGVAKFKNGVNGENYELAGTFLYIPKSFRWLIDIF